MTSSDSEGELNEAEDIASHLMPPIDLTSLIAQGHLQQEGTWYRFANIHELPPRVTDQIVDIQTTPGVAGGLIRFKLPSGQELNSGPNDWEEDTESEAAVSES
ncbi:MAG: hypothetical protein QM706_12900 [Nitrospira sp.]